MDSIRNQSRSFGDRRLRLISALNIPPIDDETIQSGAILLGTWPLLAETAIGPGSGLLAVPPLPVRAISLGHSQAVLGTWTYSESTSRIDCFL